MLRPSAVPVGTAGPFEGPGLGGRIWNLRVDTANGLGEESWWNLELEGSLVAIGGVSWAIAPAEEGQRVGGETGPGLRVTSVGPRTRVELLPGPELELDEHLARFRNGRARLLEWPRAVGEGGRQLGGGGSSQGNRFELNSGPGARWVAAPFAAGLVEIPWRVEAKRLRVRLAGER